MPIYSVESESLAKIPETTFAKEKLLERRDLQRMIRSDVSVLSPDLMVIAEEYGDWEESSRRVDLLCLDKDAHLVVVELKRTESGGHMELQAIRYAAMVSSMSFEQLVGAHARFLGGEQAGERAQSAILRFLDWDSPSEGGLSDEVRILLVAADFSIELTTAVLWLNKRDLDITCIRVKPYRLDQQILLNVEQILPLPEAADYETKIRAQQQENLRAETTRHASRERFWAQLIDRSRPHSAFLASRSVANVGRNYLRWARLRGLGLGFVLLQDASRVECYIDLGLGSEDKNLDVLNQLRVHQASIEATFGAALNWEQLDEKRACRISHETPGGWKAPESEWPALQDRMVDAMVRLEKVLKGPIAGLTISD